MRIIVFFLFTLLLAMPSNAFKLKRQLSPAELSAARNIPACNGGNVEACWNMAQSVSKFGAQPPEFFVWLRKACQYASGASINRVCGHLRQLAMSQSRPPRMDDALYGSQRLCEVTGYRWACHKPHLRNCYGLRPNLRAEAGCPLTNAEYRRKLRF